jgi:hypothetical protein
MESYIGLGEIADAFVKFMFNVRVSFVKSSTDQVKFMFDFSLLSFTTIVKGIVFWLN